MHNNILNFQFYYRPRLLLDCKRENYRNTVGCMHIRLHCLHWCRITVANYTFICCGKIQRFKFANGITSSWLNACVFYYMCSWDTIFTGSLTKLSDWACVLQNECNLSKLLFNNHSSLYIYITLKKTTKV